MKKLFPLTLIILMLFMSACSAPVPQPECAHKWNAATCTTPEICSLCGATQGNIIEHTDSGDGKCTQCGIDLILKQIKDNLKFTITPSSNNSYCEITCTNNTDYTIEFVYDYMGIDNRLVLIKNDTLGENSCEIRPGYYVTIKYEKTFYNYSILTGVYATNQSDGTTKVRVNEKTILLTFNNTEVTYVEYE